MWYAVSRRLVTVLCNKPLCHTPRYSGRERIRTIRPTFVGRDCDFDSLVWKDYQPYIRTENPSVFLEVLPIKRTAPISSWTVEESNLYFLYFAFDLGLLCTSLLVLYRPIPSVATPTSRCSLCGIPSRTRV